MSAATPLIEDSLLRAWQQPPGLKGWLSAVNHKAIGMRFIITGFVYFIIGGVFALLMRTQLIVPENSFLSAEFYNQLFTMHGTTMMFLFAIPMLEGLAIYLLPLILGTRDLPFPRLNAFGYWLYLFGGIFVFSSFLSGQVPSEGWFAYVPLSSGVFTPDMGMDFWLLGVTMVEISGIIGALELVVVFLRRRAPGMSLNRVPTFGWAIFVMASMMVVAFPVLVAASTLLELERVSPLVFFDPVLGGDPLLWQHLFWFFGHPEVYIMLLPAAGMVTMIVSVFSRRPIAGHGWIIGSIFAIGIASFGLWVHHMFATGLPSVAMTVFTAASVLIAIPSGILVFAWLATMWQGRPAFRPPLLFVIGFLLIFVIGGITGVMVASVPFDLQAHDSFFVVAHLHYVLLGGVVFPTFAALYYWFPKFTGRLTRETTGRIAFWTMFVGVNLAFFPQHFLGLQGMPRRVFTYEVGLGWELGNLLSTIGAFVLAAGVVIAVADFLRARKHGPSAGPDPWSANSLEWATASPPPPYNFRTIPVVRSRDPLWDESPDTEPTQPDWMNELAFPDQPVREVVETSPVEAAPDDIVSLPGPSLWPLWTALSVVVALTGVLISEYILAILGAAITAITMIGWAATNPGDVPERYFTQTRRAAIGVWGLSVGLVSLSAILGTLLVAHYYLMVAPEERRPVAEVDASVVWVALSLALISALVCFLARRMGARPATALVLGVVLITALGSALAGILIAADQMAVAPSSAQASSVVVLVGFGSVVGAMLGGGVIAAAVHVLRKATNTPAVLQSLQMFSVFLLATWVAIAAVILTTPWIPT